MRSNQSKVSFPPPPVPPRPSKTVIAEALAKSRKLSPVRALYATQPLSVNDVAQKRETIVPIRTAPPPPPNIVKSYSSSMVFNPKLRPTNKVVRVVRSSSDCADQSPDTKTSKIQVNLVKKPSFQSTVECSENERNNEQKQTITIISSLDDDKSNVENHSVKINTSYDNNNQPVKDLDVNIINNEIKIVDVNKDNGIIEDNVNHIETITEKTCADITKTILQSNDKTMIIVTNLTDDANNNISRQPQTQQNNHISNESNNNNNSNKIDDNADSKSNNEQHSPIAEKKTKRTVQFDDKVNHEILIAELQSMRAEQERLLKRQRKPAADIYVNDNNNDSHIQQSDWVEISNGEKVRMSSCQIYIDDDAASLDSRPGNMSSGSLPLSMHGLPPLPKSLSGFNLFTDNNSQGSVRGTPSRSIASGSSTRDPTPTPNSSGSGSGHVVYPPHPPRINGTTDIPRGRKITTLDTQLAILRREMYGLRQLDLSLLSQLYSLNESIQDFRQMLQDQDDSVLSPHSPSASISPSPSPSPSSADDEFYSPTPIRFKPTPPARPITIRRTSNSSSANSSEYGTV